MVSINKLSTKHFKNKLKNKKYHTVGTKTKSKINKEKHQDFLDSELLLTRKLLNQGFLLVTLKSSLRKFYGRHHDLVDRYGISVSQMTTDM